MQPTRFITLTTLVALTLAGVLPTVAQDPLPSWNDTAPKKAIVAFVERVTTSGAPDVVPPAERIGVARAWTQVPIVALSITTERCMGIWVFSLRTGPRYRPPPGRRRH